MDAWDLNPDGSRIAFVSYRDGDSDIYVMEADGSNQVNLTNNSDSEIEPAWSPDGSQIAFCSTRGDGSTYEIFVMNADGTGPVQLTTGEGNDFAPDWSPDGSRIVFWSLADFNIYVMNADGSGVTLLADSGESDYDPVWSPDGSRIAFLGHDGVFMVDPDGSNLEQVIEIGFWPHWSPDGSQLTYTCNGFSDICISNADGTNEVNITNHPANDTWGAFRPVVP